MKSIAWCSGAQAPIAEDNRQIRRAHDAVTGQVRLTALGEE